MQQKSISVGKVFSISHPAWKSGTDNGGFSSPPPLFVLSGKRFIFSFFPFDFSVSFLIDFFICLGYGSIVQDREAEKFLCHREGRGL
jgi:hypothetical protein